MDWIFGVSQAKNTVKAAAGHIAKKTEENIVKGTVKIANKTLPTSIFSGSGCYATPSVAAIEKESSK